MSEKKMAPHEVLIKKLAGAEEGVEVGKFLIPRSVLWGLGAQLLSITDLRKTEHRDDALRVLEKVRKNPETSTIVGIYIGDAIKALKEEAGKEKGKSKEE